MTIAERAADETAHRLAAVASQLEQVFGGAASQGSEPWDRDQARALMEAYEAQEPALAARPSPATPPPIPAKPSAGTQVLDKAALDPLRRSAEDRQFEAMEHRFAALELKIGAAVKDLARRADVADLPRIEGHVQELAQRVRELQAHSSRLDGIEQRIASVVDGLSMDKLAALFEDAVARDLDGISKRAAAEVHARLAGNEGDDQRYERLAQLIEKSIIDQRSSTDAVASLFNGLGGALNAQADRYDEMRSLIASFVEDRRRNDEQSQTALDTLQQALVEVLDRIEAIEAATARPTAASRLIEPVLEAVPVPVARAVLPEPAPAMASVSHTPTQSPLAAMADARRLEETLAGLETVAAMRPSERAENPPPVPVSAPVSDDMPMSSPMSPPVPMAAEDELAIGDEPSVDGARSAGPNAAIEKIRRELVADARRAKQKAGRPIGQADAGAASVARGAPLPSHGRPMRTGSGIAVSLPLVAAGAMALLVGVTGGLILNRGGSSEVDVAAAAEVVEKPDGRLADATGPAAAETGPSGSSLPVTTAALADTPAAAPVAKDEIASLIAATGSQQGALDMPPATVGPISLRLAAANGDPSAEFEVAARLAEGKGTEQNLKDALRWYQRSAGRGFAQSQYRLGTLFERGLGTSADAKKARVWYERAANQGNVKAMHNLAVLTAGGDAGTPDYPAAAAWFAKAAERGLADSQYNFAVLHESGLGVPADMRTAYKWYALAAKGGDADAIKRLAELKKELPAADVKAGEELMGKFMATRPDALVNDPHVAGEDWKRRQAASGNG